MLINNNKIAITLNNKALVCRCSTNSAMIFMHAPAIPKMCPACSSNRMDTCFSHIACVVANIQQQQVIYKQHHSKADKISQTRSFVGTKHTRAERLLLSKSYTLWQFPFCDISCPLPQDKLVFLFQIWQKVFFCIVNQNFTSTRQQ